MNFFSLGYQEKDPEDIAEDFRDGIWENSNDTTKLVEIWAAGRCFLDTLYPEDEFSCLPPSMPEGVLRLQASLDNVLHYVLNDFVDMDLSDVCS